MPVPPAPAPTVRPRPAGRPAGGARRSGTRPPAARARAARAARVRARRQRRRAALLRCGRRSAVVLGATLALAALAALLVQPPRPAGTSSGDLATRAQATASRLGTAAGRYRQALADAAGQQQAAQQAVTAGRAARAISAADRTVVGRYAAELYAEGAPQRDPLTTLSLRAPQATGDTLHRQGLADQLAARRAAAVATAADAAVTAATFDDEVTRATAAAKAARARAAAVLREIRHLVAHLAPQVAAAWAGAADDPAAGPLDQAALTGWQHYLGQLAAAGIDPPAAAELTDPATLPAGLAPLRNAAGAVVAGVAVTYADGQPLTVLPAETVATVSAAFATLGTAYLAGGTGGRGYGCGGLISAVAADGGIGLPADLAGQRASGTPVPAGDLQVGDLVFSSKPGIGLDDVGLFLGGTSVLSASADTGRVAVRSVTDTSDAVRVTVPPATRAAAAVTGAGAATCGAAPVVVAGPVADPAWGGFSNGRIPDGELCPIAPGQRLRCDAAAAYTAMSDAYQAVFGTPLCITDSYRSFAAQLDAHRRKPTITAVPGTSNHGWGLAVDLCGGVNAFGTAQTAWMRANAATFGWVHPAWAEDGSQVPEPWHWEFGRIS